MACCVVTISIIGMLNKGKVFFPYERMRMSIHKKEIDNNEIENLCFIIILQVEINRYDKISSIEERDFKKLLTKN